MKIMLIEDNESKSNAISSHIQSKGVPPQDIIYAKNMTDFAAKFNDPEIGLFIIDFKLPNSDGSVPSQNGTVILEAIVKAGKHDSLLLAISSYPDDFPRLRALYEAHGCILAEFSNEAGWRSTLDHLLIQLRKNLKLDFVIFCALQLERNPYILLLGGNQITRGGIDCYDVEIGKKRGSVVLLPQYGLVNAAVTAGLCIDRFKPALVGMSGICGGFKGRARLGQIFVSSLSYEYQSGKWASDGFRQEPYQVPTDHVTLTDLKVLTSTEGLISDLEHGFHGDRPTSAQKPEVGIFTSGSAVIADQEHMSQISRFHRKVHALDMEVFAVQRAAQLSPNNPPCICAKTVVDLGDKKKNDNIHAYGSYVSARFLIKAVDRFFSRVR